MAARKRVKKQTLNEFRAWLNGVEELQPDDWSPDASQWKLIREKINNISDPKPAVDTDSMQKLIETLGNNQRTAAAPPRNVYTGEQPFNPMAAGIPPAPLPPGGVPAGPVVPPSAAQAPPAQSGVTLAPAKPVDLTEVAKPKDTADNGNYESGFI